MKRKKSVLFIFLAPAIISFIAMFVYPIIVTTGMSFSHLDNISSPFSSWTFAGLDNYKFLFFESEIFIISMKNLLGIWVIGGVFAMFFALLFAVILTSGIKLKGFWRSVIYLPNVISGVAMGTMWVQYIYSAKFGLLKTTAEALGLEQLSKTQWTSPENMFLCMVIAFSFGVVGYFMLTFIAGLERIPETYYEAARLEGATVVRMFFSISLPLLKNVIKSTITLWTVIVVGFFVWSQMFTPFDISESTVAPMVYMYQLVFGSNFGTSTKNIGAGAAIGIILAIVVVISFAVVNLFFKDSEIEF